MDLTWAELTVKWAKWHFILYRVLRKLRKSNLDKYFRTLGKNAITGQVKIDKWNCSVSNCIFNLCIHTKLLFFILWVSKNFLWVSVFQSIDNLLVWLGKHWKKGMYHFVVSAKYWIYQLLCVMTFCFLIWSEFYFLFFVWGGGGGEGVCQLFLLVQLVLSPSPTQKAGYFIDMP